MICVYVGLGSNLDCPRTQLSNALKSLEQLPETRLLRYSSFYLSAPVGPQDQPDFINAVAQLHTELTPFTLLEYLQDIESGQGRNRNCRHWGPRTLDLDLLLYQAEKINRNSLIIPHPEIANRNFVLAPLLEIDPELIIPGLGPAKVLLEKIGMKGLRKIPEDG